MIGKHASENEIQQYVLDQLGSDVCIVNHMHSCKICAARAESYRILVSGIQNQQKPVFDFDIADLVLPQLTKPKRTLSWDIVVVYLLVFAGLVMILSSVILFSSYLSELYSGYSSLFIYLFGTITFILLGFQGLELYRKYHRQLEALNIV